MDGVRNGLVTPQSLVAQRPDTGDARRAEHRAAPPPLEDAPPPPPSHAPIESPQGLQDAVARVGERISHGTEPPPFRPMIRAGALASMNLASLL